MKQTKQCPKCRSLRVGFLERQYERSGEYDSDYERPAVLVEETRRAFWSGKEKLVTGRFGSLEAYICTECGYHETYVVDPQNIPWDRVAGFHFLHAEVDGEGPYR
jgi:predicted nucleic-acid-binding Zn-ribbon protein